MIILLTTDVRSQSIKDFRTTSQTSQSQATKDLSLGSQTTSQAVALHLPIFKIILGTNKYPRRFLKNSTLLIRIVTCLQSAL